MPDDSQLKCVRCAFQDDQSNFDKVGMDYHCPACGSTDTEQPFVADPDWTCPNCEDGKRMHRPGSKATCASCFHVVGGQYDGQILRDFDLTVRQARRLLYVLGEPWHGTPGDLGTRLRGVFESPRHANHLLADIREGIDA